MPDQAAKTVNDFVISRVLDAPRDLVWRCFTQVDHLKQWWGPKGVKIARANVDFRVGGSFHYAMQPPSGDIMWGKMTYREIAPHVFRRSRWRHAPSDGAGLADANAFDLHFRGHAGRQDEVHRPLVAV
jgi:uncharacterized protein YndB with AHSA1/START domain